MQIFSEQLPAKLILIQIWLCQWHIELSMMSLMTISPPPILSFRQYKNANNTKLVYIEKKTSDLGSLLAFLYYLFGEHQPSGQ